MLRVTCSCFVKIDDGFGFSILLKILIPLKSVTPCNLHTAHTFADFLADKLHYEQKSKINDNVIVTIYSSNFKTLPRFSYFYERNSIICILPMLGKTNSIKHKTIDTP